MFPQGVEPNLKLPSPSVEGEGPSMVWSYLSRMPFSDSVGGVEDQKKRLPRRIPLGLSTTLKQRA